MTDTDTAFPSPPTPGQSAVDPLFSHAASPFIRTEPPMPVAAMAPPEHLVTPVSTWATYKTQIQFGFAIVAYLMVLVGSMTVVQANGEASWRYFVAVLPVAPAALVIWLTVRALGRLGEVQKRIQVQALGFAVAATGLLTFGYGSLEGVGLPRFNLTLVLPVMALLWGLALLALNLRYRFRR